MIAGGIGGVKRGQVQTCPRGFGWTLYFQISRIALLQTSSHRFELIQAILWRYVFKHDFHRHTDLDLMRINADHI